MLKKATWGIVLVFFMVVAYGAGYLNAQWQEQEYHKAVSADQKAFDLQVEAYRPSCAELRRDGLSPQVCQNTTCFAVYTRANYFYVLGIGFSGENPPLTSWWGGGRENALEQCANR